jgi:tripartite-type tricarboxylate transporter receptor subunit TctC
MRSMLATLLTLAAALAVAQPYPAKPVRIIAAAGPGGGDDFVSRLIAPKLSEILGQQVIVENRPGAGGMIGQTFVAKSAPDGYTLLLAGGSMAGARFVNANVTYDLMRDFTPISLIETSPFALVVKQALPARSVNEFVAFARSQPGKLTYATIGAGQIPYWSVVWFNSMAGIDAVEIVYKTPAEALTDVIAGRVDYFFAPIVGAVGNRGKLRVLAVTTGTRAELMPDVPTMAEAGMGGYEMPAWRSIMGPAGLSPDIVRTLNGALARTMQDPDIRDRLAKAGSAPQTGTPEELRKRYQDWMAIFSKIARDAKIKPQ